MKAIIENLEKNLESVSETARTQMQLIEELKAEIETLKASNEKLTEQLKYESSMLKMYINLTK
jgi:cell shape-determining protein MreC